MDRTRNPYAPGAGVQPPELAGRDTFLDEAAIDMERILRGKPSRGMILLGLRGVGKTVLLNRLHKIAETKGFKTAKIEAPENGALPQLLAPELRRVIFELDLLQAATARMKRALGTFANFIRGFKVTVGDFTIEGIPGVGDTGNLQQDLPELFAAIGEAASERRTAFALFIDEVQYLNEDELSSLVVACHALAQRGLPFHLIGAGLPQVAALSGNARSYAERLLAYPEIGPLEKHAAITALTKPAEAEGARFTPDALDKIIDNTERYPYFLQEWGFHVWNHARTSIITAADVDAVTPQIVLHLDKNFFRVRYDRLTALQQKYLRAMAELGPGPHKTGDIAAILEVSPSSVATVRMQLINKGMIWSQRHGETAFTVPMFDEFMKRQMPTLEPHVPKRRSPNN
jgi:hypothetical protein